jgi:hypothetical protein
MVEFIYILCKRSITRPNNKKHVLAQLLSGFEAAAHDEAYDAFMTLPPYTRIKQSEVPQRSYKPTCCGDGRGVTLGSPVVEESEK